MDVLFRACLYVAKFANWVDGSEQYFSVLEHAIPFGCHLSNLILPDYHLRNLEEQSLSFTLHM